MVAVLPSKHAANGFDGIGLTIPSTQSTARARRRVPSGANHPRSLPVDTTATSSAMASVCEKGEAFSSNKPAEPLAHLVAVTDRMACLFRRGDELVGCTENGPQERELEALTDVI